MFVQKKIFRKRKSCGVSKEVGYIFLDRDCTLTGTKSIFGKKNIKKNGDTKFKRSALYIEINKVGLFVYAFKITAFPKCIIICICRSC